MSHSRSNNVTRMLGNQQTEPDYASYFPWDLSSGATSDAREMAHDPWRPLEERLLLSLVGLGSQPRPPLEIIVFDDDIAREFIPRSRLLIPESATGFAGQWNMPFQTHREPPRLTQDQQNAALKKLKKEIYNPMPKRITRRLSLFYRDNAKYDSTQKGKEDEDLKRCAICLDDFESREEVLLTPCNHMFHEDCIVPWVKSQGQCPVCRCAI